MAARPRDAAGGDPEAAPVRLALPFTGRWLVQNSPARRVPSHGVDVYGERYAIDFVAVDERGRTAPARDGRTLLATESPQRFFAFGRPILAPVAGVVVAVHDGEPDHPARRSPLALVPYALTQAARVRQGVAAVAGNSVILQVADSVYVALVHLQRGSIAVVPGQALHVGEELGRCGNSGNSTQPHVHLQAMDSLNLTVARGLPIVFTDFREWASRRSSSAVSRDVGIPADQSVVAPAASGSPS
ncbi:MAG TPA: M23 family metallopeptidase [Naasia sp.]|jgi:hypothetical protein